MKGLISKIIPFSSVDGPGNRTVIFLQGCNFNCIYCHNPETINQCINCGNCISKCPTNAIYINGKEVLWNKDICCQCDECIKACSLNSSPKILKLSADEIISEISNYRNFIQGITVSGGECTLQQEFLIQLFKKAKEIGLTCFIDSNGSNDFEKMQELLEITDGVMLDVKCSDSIKHYTYMGAENINVLNNLKFLADKNKLYEVRTVIVPSVLDNATTVDFVSKEISKYSSSIRYKIIKFRSLGVRSIAKPLSSPSEELIEELKTLASNNGCKNIIVV